MIRVNIRNHKTEQDFSATFDTQEEAELWVKKHRPKGKDAQIVTAPSLIAGAKFLEEVSGPMGVKLIKQEFPADYTVEYIDDILYDRQNRLEALRRERNNILCKTDWLFLPDVKIDSKYRKIYLEYRQYLRDLTKSVGTSLEIKIEPFENRLRRIHPEEFMDGGKAKDIIRIFTSYYTKEN